MASYTSGSDEPHKPHGPNEYREVYGPPAFCNHNSGQVVVPVLLTVRCDPSNSGNLQCVANVVKYGVLQNFKETKHAQVSVRVTGFCHNAGNGIMHHGIVVINVVSNNKEEDAAVVESFKEMVKDWNLTYDNDSDELVYGQCDRDNFFHADDKEKPHVLVSACVLKVSMGKARTTCLNESVAKTKMEDKLNVQKCMGWNNMDENIKLFPMQISAPSPLTWAKIVWALSQKNAAKRSVLSELVSGHSNKTWVLAGITMKFSIPVTFELLVLIESMLVGMGHTKGFVHSDLMRVSDGVMLASSHLDCVRDWILEQKQLPLKYISEMLGLSLNNDSVLKMGCSTGKTYTMTPSRMCLWCTSLYRWKGPQSKMLDDWKQAMKEGLNQTCHPIVAENFLNTKGDEGLGLNPGNQGSTTQNGLQDLYKQGMSELDIMNHAHELARLSGVAEAPPMTETPMTGRHDKMRQDPGDSRQGSPFFDDETGQALTGEAAEDAKARAAAKAVEALLSFEDSGSGDGGGAKPNEQLVPGGEDGGAKTTGDGGETLAVGGAETTGDGGETLAVGGDTGGSGSLEDQTQTLPYDHTSPEPSSEKPPSEMTEGIGSPELPSSKLKRRQPSSDPSPSERRLSKRQSKEEETSSIGASSTKGKGKEEETSSVGASSTKRKRKSAEPSSSETAKSKKGKETVEDGMEPAAASTKKKKAGGLLVPSRDARGSKGKGAKTDGKGAKTDKK